MGNASLLAKADDRVLRDVKARADVRHRHADRVETSNLSALSHGKRSELDPMRQTRQGCSPIVSGKVVRQARNQLEERLPLFREGVGEGHQKRLTRNITHVNVGVALREFLLEGFLVARELGGRGASSCLVEVSAVAADVGAVVVLAAVPVSTSTLVAFRAPAVVIALVAAVLGVAFVPAGAFAAAVLF